jgi:hypothetical protein
MTEIAGHTFAETHRGRACIALRSDGSGCHRRWTDIRNVTPADAGQPGLAHVDPINLREINEIMAERTREDAVIRDATMTAAGFGIGGMAAGTEIDLAAAVGMGVRR